MFKAMILGDISPQILKRSPFDTPKKINM